MIERPMAKAPKSSRISFEFEFRYILGRAIPEGEPQLPPDHVQVDINRVSQPQDYGL